MNVQTWEDEHRGYWTHDADGDANHSAEYGLNMIFPSKGYGKGYGQKGKAQSRGKSHNKGWSNAKGWQQSWQQGNVKGWHNNDYKAGGAKVWPGQDSKGKGKSKGTGFQVERYACGEWGHSQSRCPQNPWSASHMGEHKGKGRGYTTTTPSRSSRLETTRSPSSRATTRS